MSTRTCIAKNSAAAIGLIFAFSVSAHALDLGLGPVSVDVGPSSNGGVSANAGVGSGVSANASVGGGAGVSANANVNAGGANVSANANAGGGGVNANVNAGAGGIDGNITASVGGGGGNVSIGIGGPSTPGTPGNPGNPGTVNPRNPTITDNPRGSSGAGNSRASRVFAGMSSTEVRRYKRRCIEVTANPFSYDRNLVALCRMIRQAGI